MSILDEAAAGLALDDSEMEMNDQLQRDMVYADIRYDVEDSE